MPTFKNFPKSTGYFQGGVGDCLKFARREFFFQNKYLLILNYRICSNTDDNKNYNYNNYF